MDDDDALFGLTETRRVDEGEPAATPIKDWQVDQLRNALDATGTTVMSERQALIEELVERPVAALRELNFNDVRPLLEGLHARKAATTEEAGSTWDQRDEDTWIDKL